MASSAEHAAFPLSSPNNQSIFSYISSNSSPYDQISPFFAGEEVDYEAPGDRNVSFSITANDSLLDVLSKTLVHKAPGDDNPTEIAVGITLAVLANCIVAFSIILKKQSLKQLSADGGTPASEGGFGYLKSKRWWLGFSILLVGDLLSFISLIFAPAIVVTSLSVLSIVVTAILSPIFLKEKLTKLACIGCGLVILGCLIVTLCGPKVQEIGSMDELEFYLLSPGFISYCVIVVIVGGVLMYLAPKYGSKYIMVNVVLVGIYSSLSIMFSKGVGIGIKRTIEGENAFIRWSLWVCLVGLSISLMIELVYTQRSLDIYNIYHITSVWYVVVSALVILLSTVLFSKNRSIGWKDTTLTISGFLINAVALFILTIDKAQNKALEETQESVENESPLGDVTNENVTGDLYTIQRNPNEENLSSAASKVTSMMMKHSGPPCTLVNLSAAISSEHGKTNSCFSLIDEAPSSSKDVFSIDSNVDSNSQSGSSNGSNFKSSDTNSTGNASPQSSCSSHRRDAGVSHQCGDN